MDDSDRRFHALMDRIFNTPKKGQKESPSSSSDLQTPRGEKLADSPSSLALMESNVGGNVRAGPSYQGPECRPWDRGDLMRRLATFKSMTWFAKPEVVSALNCARRGWINVDMDTVACETCGARFLLSTPSAWNQQQVEKSAAVFSLKLDKGHKLHCPWIDNVCAEKLVQFPPTPPPILVDKFKERCSALMQLSALPVISSSAFEYMRSPQLEQIIEQSLVLECENGCADMSRVEYLRDEHDVDSEKKYYQAQKLISLCGWEPRVLPYTVDTGNKSSQPSKENVPESPNSAAHDLNTEIHVLSTRINEPTEANENSNSPYMPRSDPNSAALDCRLCGASVGLWAFCTVPRPMPMELIQLVGYGEINGGNHSEINDSRTETNSIKRGEIILADSDITTLTKERHQSLNLTIAGGPPPTKQNFKATVSLPVIGRNLRARFFSDSKSRDPVVSDQEKEHVNENGDDQNTSGVTGNSGDGEGELHIPVNNGLVSHDTGSNLIKQVSSDNKMELDPVRQHRHFCPWIASTGKGTPGWKQTLSALQRQQRSSPPSSERSPLSSIIKVDDPLASVRNIFMSPSAKKRKCDVLSTPTTEK
ncbi:hypothetical protein CsatA_001401 [Cannabis sativa]|uniref:C3HC-type domain-containing protein n=1 Tax=Cannabis sativa TaxID=3483 RepID=A0A803P4G7_CANSA